MDPSWTPEAIRKGNEDNKRNRPKIRDMRSRGRFIPTGKVEAGPKPMKPAKSVVDMKNLSSRGAKGASRQQSILTEKGKSATPANIWRGMVPMLAKKLSVLGSLLIPSSTASQEEEDLRMGKPYNATGPEREYPNPSDDSTGDMMRKVGQGFRSLYDSTKMGMQMNNATRMSRKHKNTNARWDARRARMTLERMTQLDPKMGKKGVWSDWSEKY